MGEGVLTAVPARASGRVPTDLLLADAGLVRRGRSLEAGRVSLAAIARDVGTPVYVYNADVIRERYRALDTALAQVPHQICYAVKANSNLAVMHLLAELGAGADIVSGGELARALAAGFAPERIVFSGVGKSVEELRTAALAGIGHVNVESREELELLGGIAAEVQRNVTVGIRVNPDVTTDTHPYISTGKRGIKFGVPTDQVVAAVEYVHRHPWLTFGAIAMHLGSQLVDTDPYRQGVTRLLELLDELRRGGLPLPEAIDIGGGLGIRYHDDRAMDPERYAAAVVPLLAATGLTVFLEPGRYLVGSAGILLTRVLYRKHSGGKEFVIVDAAMNDLMRPSLYQAYHEIVEVEAADRPNEVVDVVGPICETGDFLALDRTLPGVVAGEVLAVLGAGAYGFVMSSNYNTRPRPAEVIVDGDRSWVARPREQVDALFNSERTEE